MLTEFHTNGGVVGCGRGDGYLKSLGRPTDIGFQLGKACYPFLAGKGRGGNVLYFFCFFTFIPVPLSSLTLSFISCTISSPFLRETTQNDPQGLMCR